jgi:hypothetical protein
MKLFVKDALRRAPASVTLNYALSKSQIAHIVGGLVICFAIQYGSLFYVNRFHKRFLSALDAKSARDFGVRCASSTWGVFCGVWAGALLRKALKTSTNTLSRMYASPPLDGCEELVCLAVGYFIYDTIVSYKYYGTQYFLHAVVSVVTFLLPQFMPKGFLHVYAANFLLWEATLPFLAARYIMIKAGMGSTRIFKIVELTGFGLWVLIRFVIGVPMMYLYFTDAYAMFKAGKASPLWLYAWYTFASAVLQLMNVIWLSAIVKALFSNKKGTVTPENFGGNKKEA